MVMWCKSVVSVTVFELHMQIICERRHMLHSELTLKQRILIRAAELIGRPQGWCKRQWYDNERVCMLGAIGRATTELTGLKHSNRVTEILVLRDAYGNTFNENVDSVVDLVAPFSPIRVRGRSALVAFNDAPNTTQEQVREVFCKAVKKELGEGGEDQQ